MTTEGKEAGAPAEGAQEEQPKSREDILEEAVLELVDKVEGLIKDVDLLKKTAVKKSTQRFGTEHGRKAVKDNKTGTVYPSLYSAGKALAGEFGEDPGNQQVWYKIQKADPERFEVLTEDSAEAQAAWSKADAELQRSVDEANKAAAAGEAAKTKEEPAKTKGK